MKQVKSLDELCAAIEHGAEFSFTADQVEFSDRSCEQLQDANFRDVGRIVRLGRLYIKPKAVTLYKHKAVLCGRILWAEAKGSFSIVGQEYNYTGIASVNGAITVE